MVTSGHRLSSGAIEEAVSSHPRIGECAVIGVPDPLKAEVPAAFVVLKVIEAPLFDLSSHERELLLVFLAFLTNGK